MNRIVITDPAKQDLLDISRFIGGGQKQLVHRSSRGVQGEAFGEEICKFMSEFIARMLRPYMGRRWDNIVPLLRSFPVESYILDFL